MSLCECLHAKRALAEWNSSSSGQHALYEMGSSTKIAVRSQLWRSCCMKAAALQGLSVCADKSEMDLQLACLHGMRSFCLFTFSACDWVSHLQLSDLELPHNKKCKVTRLAASWVCLRARLELQHSEELELRQGTELQSGAAWEIKASCFLRGWCD